jgi:hypothetical protein
MERQVFNFIEKTLVHMNVAPAQINEEADILFDLNLDVIHLDFLFSVLENRYRLNTSLVFTKEVATLRGLADFVELRAA